MNRMQYVVAATVLFAVPTGLVATNAQSMQKVGCKNRGQVIVQDGATYVCSYVNKKTSLLQVFPTDYEVVHLTDACASGGTTVIRFGLFKQDGKYVQPIPDDGNAKLQIRTDDGWVTLTMFAPDELLKSGGEGTMRLDTELFGKKFDLLRVTHKGWGSNVYAPRSSCS